MAPVDEERFSRTAVATDMRHEPVLMRISQLFLLWEDLIPLKIH